MITKTPAKNGKTTKVTFELPPESASQRVCLCGDFNDWSQEATPLTKRKDGRFSATVTLPQGKTYRFKYFVDGERWENDNAADEYVDNDYGSKDSVVIV
jgi:1,4-alpha-glucan branching enzyme